MIYLALDYRTSKFLNGYVYGYIQTNQPTSDPCLLSKITSTQFGRMTIPYFSCLIAGPPLVNALYQWPDPDSGILCSLPVQVRQMECLSTFGSRLKQHLFLITLPFSQNQEVIPPLAGTKKFSLIHVYIPALNQ